MNRRDLVIGLLVLTAATLFGVWFLNHFERATREIETGFQGEARRNPYLAAQRFLERTGVEADSIGSLDQLSELPATSATLYLPTERLTLDARRTQALLDWIRTGGHLVVVIWGDAEANRRDPLLAPFGVVQYFEEEPEENEVPANVDLPNAPDFYQVGFLPWYRMEDPDNKAIWRVEDDTGIHALQYAAGQGYLTVLTDMDFMNNDAIGQYDHAAVLWYLSHMHGRQGQVLFVYNDDMPALGRLLWDRLPEALISAAVLLGVWLWLASRRFGPPLPEPARARRSLLEHLTASGRFLWRQHKQETLVTALRQRFFQTLRQRHPGWTTLAGEDLCRRLAVTTGLQQKHIQAALYGPAPQTPIAFTHLTRDLEQLRKRL